jgi:hypothetical protein
MFKPSGNQQVLQRGFLFFAEISKEFMDGE